QKSHVDHSFAPCLMQSGRANHMGQFSMKISAIPGSVLSDIQQAHLPPRIMTEPYRRALYKCMIGIACSPQVSNSKAGRASSSWGRILWESQP
ncbi:hypothetical protein, partial [Paracoccus versutus]|uniref:hypothetical protein n=1 Tax=Paracoccus versutus TaxID=34007 RepID=UPI001AD7E881